MNENYRGFERAEAGNSRSYVPRSTGSSKPHETKTAGLSVRCSSHRGRCSIHIMSATRSFSRHRSVSRSKSIEEAHAFERSTQKFVASSKLPQLNFPRRQLRRQDQRDRGRCRPLGGATITVTGAMNRCRALGTVSMKSASCSRSPHARPINRMCLERLDSSTKP